MQKALSPIFIVSAIVVMLGLIAYGAYHAMTPHEKIVKSTGIKLSPAMQQRLAAMRQHALANHPVVATTVTH